MHVGQTEQEFGSRFASGDWAASGGSVQSLGFALAVVMDLTENFPSLMPFFGGNGQGLIDYGCALGDGTAALAAMFPRLTVIGCDISQEAIDLASQRWPTLTFLKDDIEHPTQVAHILWTSHTIEHLADPGATIAELRRRCRLLVACFPPITDEQTEGPHVGAPLTRDWFHKIEVPLYRANLTTFRRGPDHDGGFDLLKEESILCVWRGTHPE